MKLIAFVFLFISVKAFAGNSPIRANFDIARFQGVYQNYSQRNNISANSVTANFQYLDKTTVTGKFAKTSINLANDYSYDQAEYFGGIRQKIYFNHGVLHIGGGYMNMSPSSGSSVQTGVASLGLGTLNKKHYVGVSGGESFYNGLKIKQASFIYTYSFNQKHDSIELNVHRIFSSDATQTNNKSIYHALIAKYTHYLKTEMLLFVDEIGGSFMFGSRMYGINNDTMQINNLPQIENFALTIGPSWHIKDTLRIHLRYSLNKYSDISLNESYRLQGVYLSMNTNF